MKNLTVGRGRTVRIGPWRGDNKVATIATFIDQRLDRDAVDKIVSTLSEQGYQRTITAALATEEHQAFVENGFEPLRHLTLLRRPLDAPIPKAQLRVRRWRRRRFNQVLDIDHDAFEPFWRFDETALREALAATPHRILRVDSTVNPTGYALSGVARGSAYLQRLAVRPDAAGSGLGTALLLDALRWMRWRGADVAFVNTQHDNHRALDLYRHHGFEAEPEGLTIFQRDL